jgi:hypothetical protein
MAAAPTILHFDLDSLNHTELVLLTKWCGLPASRAIPRELLIESLETFTPIDASMPFDEKRKSLSTWIKRHWNIVRMQMPKKVCPRCELCKDLQVLDCYTVNESLIKPGPARR